MADDSFDYYSVAFTKLSSTLTTYVSDTATSIIGAIGPVAAQLLTLYFIIYGISMMRGLVEEPISDFAMRVIKTSIILALALNIGIYNGQIVNFLWNSPDKLAQYVSGAGSSTVANMDYLDSLMTQFYNLGDKYWQFSSGATSLDIGPKIMAVVTWLAGVVVTVYAAFLLILAKMALAVILGIGPIFVLLLMFEGTKRFFESWFGQALNYVFVVVLTSAAVKLILSLIVAYMPSANAVAADTGSIAAAIPPIALAGIGALVMMQLSSVASALGGGVAISTLGAGNAVWNKAKGAAGGAKNLASGKTLSDMRAQRRAKATNAKWAARNPGMTANVAGMSMKAFKAVTATPNRVKSA
jgi:type IV secretion system protein VirB6